MTALPAPRTQPIARHLGRWGTDPLGLLAEGALLGPVFELSLWRRVIVGHSPDWNRLVLGELATFRSRGSMSGLSPYLAGGVVQTDFPDHRPRRALLNPAFHRRALSELETIVGDIVQAQLPQGPFDAGSWASEITRKVLSAVFFDDQIPLSQLDKFLAPLDKRLPAPFLRRPLLFRRMNRRLASVIEEAAPPSLAAAFSGLPNSTEELRVVLSAGYDTTAHTLAWMLWHLVEDRSWAQADRVDSFINETLRLYPAGWVGSRLCAETVQFGDITIAAGTMVLYSPWLTHRNIELWNEPLTFCPERFSDPLPAWGFIPFAAGERTCLGMHLARLLLRAMIAPFRDRQLHRVSAYPQLRAGITLSPKHPMILDTDTDTDTDTARTS